MSGSDAARQSPLAGKRVLVTRARHQAAALAEPLRKLGADVVEFPVIEIDPLPDAGLDEALSRLDEYDWIVLTSVNTVDILAERIPGSGHPRIAAIGDATAAALRDRGISVDLVPREFVAEAVLEALIELGVAGQRVLLPRAEVARNVLPDGLRAAGASVDVVAAYVTRKPAQIDRAALEDLRSGNVDIVTFTSPSTVHNLLDILGGVLPESVRVACIGPVTARAAEQGGLNVDIMAAEYSIPGLIQAMVESEAHEHV